ncbi:hypothetical protein [Amycolatopsis sp.]|uniref:hypothetical protein n=1 Tax=Amycolatopsis sp. TaxID=37632 RepID=UPI002E17D2E7
MTDSAGVHSDAAKASLVSAMRRHRSWPSRITATAVCLESMHAAAKWVPAFSIGVSIRSTRRPSQPRDKFYVADCEVYCKEQTWRRAPAESISGQQEDAEHVGQFQDGGPHESPSIRTIDHTARWNLGEPTIESWQRKQDCGWSTKIAPDFVATLHGVDEFDHNGFRHERSRGTTSIASDGNQ